MVKFLLELLVVGGSSVSKIWKVIVPAVVGVPEITPVEEFKLRPAGNEPEYTAQRYGGVPPVPVIVVE